MNDKMNDNLTAEEIFSYAIHRGRTLQVQAIADRRFGGSHSVRDASRALDGRVTMKQLIKAKAVR